MNTLAGSASKGIADGAGTAAQFNNTSGVAVDGEGSIIVADLAILACARSLLTAPLSTGFAGNCEFLDVPSRNSRCFIAEHTVAKIAGCVCFLRAEAQKRRLAFCMLSHERHIHTHIATLVRPRTVRVSFFPHESHILSKHRVLLRVVNRFEFPLQLSHLCDNHVDNP